MPGTEQVGIVASRSAVAFFCNGFAIPATDPAAFLRVFEQILH